MLKTTFVSFALVYVFLVIYAWLVSDFVIFRPPPPSYVHTPEFVVLRTKSGTPVTARYLKTPQSSVTLLLSHGNAEDIGHLENFLSAWQKRGFSILTYDYPGYGTSGGTPSSQGALEAAQAAYLYLREQGVKSEAIIPYGRSLGGALAAFLAARYPTGKILLESTFVSAFRVLTYYPILPFDKFNTIAELKHVKAPILFIHGTEDTVIPFWHGKKLYDSSPSLHKEFFWVEGASHNNLVEIAKEAYFKTIENFLLKK